MLELKVTPLRQPCSIIGNEKEGGSQPFWENNLCVALVFVIDLQNTASTYHLLCYKVLMNSLLHKKITAWLFCFAYKLLFIKKIHFTCACITVALDRENGICILYLVQISYCVNCLHVLCCKVLINSLLHKTNHCMTFCILEARCIFSTYKFCVLTV